MKTDKKTMYISAIFIVIFVAFFVFVISNNYFAIKTYEDYLLTEPTTMTEWQKIFENNFKLTCTKDALIGSYNCSNIIFDDVTTKTYLQIEGNSTITKTFVSCSDFVYYNNITKYEIYEGTKIYNNSNINIICNENIIIYFYNNETLNNYKYTFLKPAPEKVIKIDKVRNITFITNNASEALKFEKDLVVNMRIQDIDFIISQKNYSIVKNLDTKYYELITIKDVKLLWLFPMKREYRYTIVNYQLVKQNKFLDFLYSEVK